MRVFFFLSWSPVTAQVRAGEVGVEGAESLRGDDVQRHRTELVDSVERNHGSILGVPRGHVQVRPKNAYLVSSPHIVQITL